MLTFGELAWAAYIYAIVTQGDKAYWEVEQSRKLIDDFVRAPTSSRTREIESVVVKQFLNRWGGCRISSKKTSRIAGQLVKTLKSLEAAEIHSLSTLSIGDVGAGRLSDNFATCIKNLYHALRCIDGCGPTVVSKILFVLFPKLFMMWDWPIRNYLRSSEQPMRKDESEGYVAFLHFGGKMAKGVSDDYRGTLSQSDTPEDYLSCRLNAQGKTKTLAKYLDEYLWIKITKIGEIAHLFPPPEWLTTLARS
jgi:hypothetical protein